MSSVPPPNPPLTKMQALMELAKEFWDIHEKTIKKMAVGIASGLVLGMAIGGVSGLGLLGSTLTGLVGSAAGGTVARKGAKETYIFAREVSFAAGRGIRLAWQKHPRVFKSVVGAALFASLGAWAGASLVGMGIATAVPLMAASAGIIGACIGFNGVRNSIKSCFTAAKKGIETGLNAVAPLIKPVFVAGIAILGAAAAGLGFLGTAVAATVGWIVGRKGIRESLRAAWDNKWKTVGVAVMIPIAGGISECADAVLKSPNYPTTLISHTVIGTESLKFIANGFLPAANALTAANKSIRHFLGEDAPVSASAASAPAKAAAPASAARGAQAKKVGRPTKSRRLGEFGANIG